MLKLEFTGRFKKDYKIAVKRGCNPKRLEEVLELLQNEEILPLKILRSSACEFKELSEYERM